MHVFLIIFLHAPAGVVFFKIAFTYSCVAEFGKPSGQCRSVPEKQQHVQKSPPF